MENVSVRQECRCKTEEREREELATVFRGNDGMWAAIATGYRRLCRIKPSRTPTLGGAKNPEKLPRGEILAPPAVLGRTQWVAHLY